MEEGVAGCGREKPSSLAGMDWQALLSLYDMQAWLRSSADNMMELTRAVQRDSEGRRTSFHLDQLQDIHNEISARVEQLHALLKVETSLQLVIAGTALHGDLCAVRALWHQLRISAQVLRERLLRTCQIKGSSFIRSRIETDLEENCTHSREVEKKIKSDFRSQILSQRPSGCLNYMEMSEDESIPPILSLTDIEGQGCIQGDDEVDLEVDVAMKECMCDAHKKLYQSESFDTDIYSSVSLSSAQGNNFTTRDNISMNNCSTRNQGMLNDKDYLSKRKESQTVGTTSSVRSQQSRNLTDNSRSCRYFDEKYEYLLDQAYPLKVKKKEELDIFTHENKHLKGAQGCSGMASWGGCLYTDGSPKASHWHSMGHVGMRFERGQEFKAECSPFHIPKNLSGCWWKSFSNDYVPTSRVIPCARLRLHETPVGSKTRAHCGLLGKWFGSDEFLALPNILNESSGMKQAVNDMSLLLDHDDVNQSNVANLENAAGCHNSTKPRRCCCGDSLTHLSISWPNSLNYFNEPSDLQGCCRQHTPKNHRLEEFSSRACSHGDCFVKDANIETHCDAASSWKRIEDFVQLLDEFIHWLFQAVETTEKWTLPKADLDNLRCAVEMHQNFKQVLEAHRPLKDLVIKQGRELLELRPTQRAGLRSAILRIEAQWRELQRQIGRQDALIRGALHRLHAQLRSERMTSNGSPLHLGTKTTISCRGRSDTSHPLFTSF
uniref:A-kinase anchor protein 6-like n=1 Tax=Myxine glutinosa TaxID=7769 RepID=UPI00358E56F2